MVKNDLERGRLGQRIAALRKKQGITQAEMAARTGISQAHISLIEKGSYSVGFDRLVAIAAALGKKIDLV